MNIIKRIKEIREYKRLMKQRQALINRVGKSKGGEK